VPDSAGARQREGQTAPHDAIAETAPNVGAGFDASFLHRKPPPPPLLRSSGSSALWSLALSGTCAVWHLRCLALALSGTRAVWHSRRHAFALFSAFFHHHIVHIAIEPIFSRLDRLDQRVLGGPIVLRRMLVLGRITAADVAAATQARRWTHVSPMATHSSQTRDLGGTRSMVSMWRQTGVLDIAGTSGRPMSKV
jgi:hypothetical protein